MQIQNIVVPIDFSRRGDRALEQADLLAKEEGAKLTVLHTIHLRLMERLLVGDRRNQLLEDTKRQLEAHTKGCCKSDAESLVEMGNPADVIMDTARLRQADLVVIGDHGEFHLKDAVLGTTARQVIEHAHLPILVVKTPESKPYKRIFLATDFSDASYRAIALAMRLFEGATFILYHGYIVPSDTVSERYNLADKEISQMHEQMRQSASEELERFKATLPSEATLETLLLPATSPAQDILSAALESEADLIALGTKGVGSFMPMMVGSVADAMLRRAPIDMLIYKS